MKVLGFFFTLLQQLTTTTLERDDDDEGNEIKWGARDAIRLKPQVCFFSYF